MPATETVEEVALAPHTHYIGRQPILDADQQIFGYELLFRAGLDNKFTGDSDEATRQVIDNALLFGLDTLAPGALAFLNCTRESLLERLVTSLPAKSTVLELHESVALHEDVLEACIDLRQQGYRFAIEDYRPAQSTSRLLALADFVKLDFGLCSPDDISEAQRSLLGTNIQCIAEKVETEEEFHRARDAGYAYFQGYFFARPTILHRREIPPSQMIYIQLLGAISRDPYDEREVERLVVAEASLCFRLLRLVNSPAIAIRGRITSIRQALLMIGQDQFRKLVTVASATSFGKRFGMSSELILLALHRARFCELLAPLSGQIDGEQYLIGLLSAFDAILQIPTAQILEMLPLRPEAAAVLLGHETPAALPFRLFQCYEQRQWVRCARFCHTLHISESQLTTLYLTSLQWASKEVRDAGL